MKTDRELLEAAARAAGIRLEWDGDPANWTPMYYEGKTYHSWEPLTDDGDALRLAVKLNLTCRFYFGNTCAQATVPGSPSAYEDVQNSADPLAGARRAIVQAAAAMAP